MAVERPEVYGVVSGSSEDGTLTIELENGELGIAAFEQISRQANIRRDNLERMIGWRLGFLPMNRREDGLIELSGRAFEEQEFERIRDDFRKGNRNIYPARLVSVTADGKLAFYRLAQGVNGALHVSQFSLCRVFSFREIDLPRELSVAISDIDGRGWLSLSAKPAFGDFEYSVRRLELTEGSVVEGVVTGIMADGAVAVMLAPNLTVLTDASCRVFPGDWVKVRCRRIDWEQHRIKTQMIERIGQPERRFSYAEWIRLPEEMGAYVNLSEFDARIRLSRPVPVEKPQEKEGEKEIEYTVSASRSPFSTFKNERIVREAHHPSRIQDIYFETRMGYLSERHLKVAAAVEELKYSSAWQVRRFLHLKEGLSMPDREIKGIVDRLIKHDIIGVLRFQSDEGSLLTRVLHPALNYRSFCGRHPRNFGPRDFMETNPANVKMRLAANQLLIGLMHSRSGLEEPETHPFLRDEEIEVRIRPRHTVMESGRKYYIEAVRSGWEEEFFSKLHRYAQLFEHQKIHDACVLVALENQEHVQNIREQIAEMKLPFAVWLTDDLSCLPEPKFIQIPAAARSLLQRIIQKIDG